MKKLSWTPKRRGRLYCAPACGRGCTRAEFLRANREAKESLARIKREEPGVAVGLKIRVWENMGWFWQLRGSDFVLHPDLGLDGPKGTFWILASPGGNGGRPQWNTNLHGTPVKLLRSVLKLAKAEVAELQGAVDRMEALLQ